MSRPVEKALGEIIPRLSGPLPPELIDLASSLLAQSRSKISNLKAEEEIGRAYACAHIACERLKTSLNLPKIEPRPPCPPRIYNKLYAYFDRELSSAARKRGRPRKDASTPSRPLPQRHAPSLEKSLEGFRANRTPRHGLRDRGSARERQLPKWVAPGIRTVCAGLDAGKAVPHVLAGVESILFLPCPGIEDLEGDQTMHGGQSAGAGADDGMKGKTPALITAVLSFTIARLTGEETDAKEYRQRVKTALDILRDMREDEAMLEKIGEADEGWEGWEPVTKKDVDEWLRTIGTKGWLRMDWWENMDDGTGVSGQVGDAYDEGDLEAYEEDPAVVAERQRQIRWVTRSGTMLQEEVDYLSDDKVERYARWKQLMLMRIDDQRP